MQRSLTAFHPTTILCMPGQAFLQASLSFALVKKKVKNHKKSGYCFRLRILILSRLVFDIFSVFYQRARKLKSK